MSQSYRTAFLLALTAPRGREEGYDVSMLPAMTEADRRFAEDALIDRTARGDAMAAWTLGKLKLQRARATLWSAAKSPHPGLSFQALRALVQLGDAVALEHLAALAVDGGRLVRFALAMDFADVPGSGAFELLAGALADPVGLIRSRAWESLIARFGLVALTKLPGPSGLAVALETPIQTIDMMLMADREPVWRRGVTEATTLARGLDEGRSAESLGLLPVVLDPGFRQALTEAWFDETEPRPWSQRPIAARLAASTGHERRFAEVFLALQLEVEPVRPLATELLRELGATWVW